MSDQSGALPTEEWMTGDDDIDGDGRHLERDRPRQTLTAPRPPWVAGGQPFRRQDDGTDGSDLVHDPRHLPISPCRPVERGGQVRRILVGEEAGTHRGRDDLLPIATFPHQLEDPPEQLRAAQAVVPIDEIQIVDRSWSPDVTKVPNRRADEAVSLIDTVGQRDPDKGRARHAGRIGEEQHICDSGGRLWGQPGDDVEPGRPVLIRPPPDLASLHVLEEDVRAEVVGRGQTAEPRGACHRLGRSRRVLAGSAGRRTGGLRSDRGQPPTRPRACPEGRRRPPRRADSLARTTVDRGSPARAHGRQPNAHRRSATGRWQRPHAGDRSRRLEARAGWPSP